MKRTIISTALFVALLTSTGCVTKVVEVPATEPAPPPATASAETMRLRLSPETERNFYSVRLKTIYPEISTYIKACQRPDGVKISDATAKYCEGFNAETKRLGSGEGAYSDWIFAQKVCVDFDSGKTESQVLEERGLNIYPAEQIAPEVQIVWAAVYHICPEHTLAIENR